MLVQSGYAPHFGLDPVFGIEKLEALRAKVAAHGQHKPVGTNNNTIATTPINTNIECYG